MPFCPQCGAQMPEGAQFCGACGASLAPPAQPPVQAAPKSGKKNKTGLIVLVLLLLVAAGIAWLLWRGQVVEDGPVPPDVIVTSPGLDGSDMSDVPSIQDLLDAETLPEGFQRFEDMDPEELATYLENLKNK